jgi:hypothetical protein
MTLLELYKEYTSFDTLKDLSYTIRNATTRLDSFHKYNRHEEEPFLRIDLLRAIYNEVILNQNIDLISTANN